MTNQNKPKCGVGQSCGYSCISIKDTCKDKVDPGTSAGLISLVQNAALYKAKSLQSFTSAADAGKTFDELAAKYPFKAGVEPVKEKIGDLDVWYMKVDAADDSGDSMTYAVALKGKRSFTLSDGNVKEVLASDVNARLKEGLAAALRAKATDIVQGSVAPAVFANGIAEYTVAKELGSGYFGKAVLTDRGTVVKELTDQPDVTDIDKMLLQEAEGLSKMHELGIGPAMLGIDKDGKRLEMEFIQGKTLDKLKTANRQAAMIKAVQAVFKLHKAGWAHSDLHDGNVIVLPDGSVKIIDAGLAGAVGSKAGGGYKAVHSGWHDLQSMLPPKHPLMQDIEASLIRKGALKQFAKRYSSIMELADATDEQKDKIRSDSHAKLHADYLEALQELGL